MEYTGYDYASLGICLLAGLAVSIAARRRGVRAAVAVWIAGGVAAAAYALAGVWGSEMLKDVAAWRFALGGASTLVVPTVAALVLACIPAARRLRAPAHLLLALALTAASFAGARALLLGSFDMVTASCDGDCDVRIVGRSTAERTAHRMALAPCDSPVTVPDEWRPTPVLPLAAVGLRATLRLPVEMVNDSEVPNPHEVQVWDSDDADLMLMREDSASHSSGMGAGPGDGKGVVAEGECRATMAGRAVAVRRHHWSSVPRGGGAPTETYAAVTDLPLEGDAELGIAVSAPSAARRDQLLAALLAMRIVAAR